MLAARNLLTASLFGIVLTSVSLPAFAQQYDFSNFDVFNFNLPNTETSLVLGMDPLHPRPGNHVRLSAQSVLLDLSKMNVVWTANGTTIAQGVGVVDADLVAGPLGSHMNVVIDANSGVNSASAHLTIIPTEVDLLYESDSYVPPFYLGRALPTEQTNVRIQAVPQFKRADGSFVAASSLIYTWKRNGLVVSAVSGKGTSSIVLPSPALFGTDTVSLEAATADGTMSGDASIQIASVSPLLLLYQDHPLFGIMYYRALGREASIPETEMTFMAVPYFAYITNPNDASLQYAWRVNNEHITADPLKRNEVTVNSSNGAQQALIHLELTQSQNFIFNPSGEWSVVFGYRGGSKSADGTNNNPFLPQK